MLAWWDPAWVWIPRAAGAQVTAPVGLPKLDVRDVIARDGTGAGAAVRMPRRVSLRLSAEARPPG